MSLLKRFSRRFKGKKTGANPKIRPCQLSNSLAYYYEYSNYDYNKNIKRLWILDYSLTFYYALTI